MKIAFITSGRLPVPATSGGAVETKLDYLMEYNSRLHLHDITMYAVKPDVKCKIPQTAENHYVHFNTESFLFRIGSKLYGRKNKSAYYDSHIEYFLYKCLRHARKQRFDVIITTNRPGYTEKIGNSVGAPVIIQLNNDYLNPETRDAAKIKSACKGIITCSHFINKQASRVDSSRQPSIITVHNGIDIERFSAAQPISREKFGLCPEDFVVVFSGRIIKEKGVLELIKAIKVAKRSIANLKLVVIGTSFFGKGNATSPYMQQLTAEAEPIRQQVIFTGFVDYGQMPSYIKIADVAALPSLWDEPFGLTILEAMAAGVPLITTNGGGIPEICQDTAILIERNSDIVNAIAKAICHVHDHPDEAEELALRAKKRSRVFDKDVFCKNYFDAVQAIISDKP